MRTVDDLPKPLLIWLRCQFFRIRDLRQLELRTETRMLYEQLHPQAGPRRLHLLPHWVQRLHRMDPAAVEVLCRQLLELEEPSLRGASARARELRARWESAALSEHVQKV